MIDLLKKLLGIAPKPDLNELARQGAIILDVRSKGEFAGGHIKGAINIPLDQLSANLNKLKDKNQPIITCCASGMLHRFHCIPHSYRSEFDSGRSHKQNDLFFLIRQQDTQVNFNGLRFYNAESWEPIGNRAARIHLCHPFFGRIALIFSIGETDLIGQIAE